MTLEELKDLNERLSSRRARIRRQQHLEDKIIPGWGAIQGLPSDDLESPFPIPNGEILSPPEGV